MLGPEFIRGRQIFDRCEIKGKRPKDGVDFAGGYQQDTRDVDGLLGDKLHRLCDDRDNVWRAANSIQHKLTRRSLLLYSLNDLGLDLGLLHLPTPVASAKQSDGNSRSKSLSEGN